MWTVNKQFHVLNYLHCLHTGETYMLYSQTKAVADAHKII